MVRTWMDSVVAFAFVGITFEMIENVAFGAAASISHIIAGIVTVIIILRWQKSKKLDVPVLEKHTAC